MFTQTTFRDLTAASVAALVLTGGLSAATIIVPTGQPTIQDAIDAAANGDDIVVMPGVYNETIDFLGKSITVRSFSDADDTVITGEGLPGPVVTFANGETIAAKLIRFTITGAENTSSSGGGILVSNADPYILSCEITANKALGGAGAYVVGGSPLFIDCTFKGNTALDGANGGGMLHILSSAFVDSCTFVDNFAEQGGGLYVASPSNVSVVNGVLDGNGAIEGGAAYANGDTTFDNCTIVGHGNGALWSGIGLLTVNNSIVRNPSDEIVLDGGTALVQYSNVEGGYTGPGNIDADPRFLDAGMHPYRLQPGSPCIDAGSNLITPAGLVIDRASFPRFIDDLNITDTGAGGAPVIDMGAYEWQATVRYVRANATGANSGLSWDDAYLDLQDALADAEDGDATEIWVASGTYKPDGGTGDRNATFALVSNVSMYGGFSGAETLRENRDGALNPTTLGGAIGADGTDDNTFHVVSALDVDNARLDSFIVQRGNAAGGGSLGNNGGGVLVDNSELLITRCIIRLNESVASGSGLYVNGGSDVTVRRTRFNLNESDTAGAIYVNESDALFQSCFIHGNTSRIGAGGLYADDSNVQLDNCTLLANATTDTANGGATWSLNSTLSIRNSILWNNQPGANGTLGNQIGGASTGYDIRASIIQDYDGSVPAAFTFGDDPQFEDADGPDDVYGTIDDNVRLTANSPAIDSGDNAFAGPMQDFDGGDRKLDDVGMPDVGLGSGPIVDRGADEFDGASCLGDFNGDDTVDAGDLAVLLSQWGLCDGYCAADLDGDQTVGAGDLATLLSLWGGCP